MRVGMIGLGNMGAGMAASLYRAGLLGGVCDPRPEATEPFVKRGIRAAETPAELARGCDIVCSSLPGPVQVEDVLIGEHGVVHGLGPGGVHIELSTSNPELIRAIEPRFSAIGASLVDAPVSGGVEGAAAGRLTLMVGASDEVFAAVKPALDALGSNVIHVGALGAGAVVKLVHNMINFGIAQALAEGFTLGVKAGVDPARLWECIRTGGVGRAFAVHDSIPRKVFRGDWDPPTFSLNIAYKDISLAVQLAQDLHVPTPVADIALERATEGMSRGWANRDAWIQFTLQEEAAGVVVRTNDVPI